VTVYSDPRRRQCQDTFAVLSRQSQLSEDVSRRRRPLCSKRERHRSLSRADRSCTFLPSTKYRAACANETLLLQSGDNKYPESWSADGQWLAYSQTGKQVGTGGLSGLLTDYVTTLSILPLSNPQKAYPYLETPFDKDEPQFSPDGHWIAYVSNESGRSEIYMQAFPGPGAKVRVSTSGGGQPKWRRDAERIAHHRGRELERRTEAPRADEIDAAARSHFTFACAFRRSAQ